jgi:hypothetical protein
MDHLYFSPRQFHSAMDEMSQPLVARAEHAMIMVSQSNLHTSPADTRVMEFSRHPVSLNHVYSGDSSLQGGWPAPVHCGNLWDSASMWNSGCLQLESQASFSAVAFPAPSEGYLADFTFPDFGMQAGFSGMLEAKDSPLTGHRLVCGGDRLTGELHLHRVRVLRLENMFCFHSICMFLANCWISSQPEKSSLHAPAN